MRGRRAARRGALSVCALGTWLLAAPGGFPGAAPARAAGPTVGSSAPEIELSDVGGTPRKVLWGEKNTSATVIYFFDPQTPECLLEMSFLDALYERAHDFGLAVYAVEARGRQPAEVSRSMERYCTVYRQPAFPVLPDPSFRAGRTYGVESVPTTFVTESHGVVLDRIPGYDHTAAVAIARRVEQLLRRDRGTFTPLLRESGISEAEERAAEAQLQAASAGRASSSQRRALGAGDRAPAVDFTDLAGRNGHWAWDGARGAGPRLVAFIGGLALTSIEELTWLDTLARRGRDAGLEVLAVEAGGMDAAALGAALERYRRYNPELVFPVVVDPGGSIAGAFGPLEQLPQTYLVGGDGTIIYRAEGFSAGEAEIMTGKIERAFALAGRPFPPARSSSGPAAVGAEPPPIDEEAPSIRKKREADERYRSSIVQGDAFFMSWEFDRALPQYLAALEVEPKDLHALVRVAQIYERRGDPAQALEFWQRVIAVSPGHAEAAARIKELQPTR